MMVFHLLAKLVCSKLKMTLKHLLFACPLIHKFCEKCQLEFKGHSKIVFTYSPSEEGVKTKNYQAPEPDKCHIRKIW